MLVAVGYRLEVGRWIRREAGGGKLRGDDRRFLGIGAFIAGRHRGLERTRGIAARAVGPPRPADFAHQLGGPSRIELVLGQTSAPGQLEDRIADRREEVSPLGEA